MDCCSSNSKTHFLSISSLLVFNNTINPELMRSLHVYKSANGIVEKEREFVLKPNGSYQEMEAQPVLRVSSSVLVTKGFVNGLWLCVFAFHSPNHLSSNIPSFLNLSRNPKLKSIPSLANDLQAIWDLIGESEQGNNKTQRSSHILQQDLNCLPYKTSSEKKKKKRATSKDVAGIALSDLAKYFNLPIVEASRKLKVGLTALKRKCREFGITRWPHRKIKSLGSLIHDLQEERKWEVDEAETAAAKRQKMLENEKESIERKPFLDMKMETKRFRQDVFKRRHRARLLSSTIFAT